MLKKIIVADIDDSLSGSLKSFCNPSKVKVTLYSNGEEILPLLGLEDPVLIFLSLDLQDVNDFVVFDILKRCSGSPSPAMYILYSQESEPTLNSVMRMKFKADGYLKKPVDKSDLSEIIKKSLDSDCYLIPSDLSMKDILGDEDILDLGREAEEIKEHEIESSDDILIENLPLIENNNDHGTREEIKKVTIKSLDDIPNLDDSAELEDSPFQMDDEPDMAFEVDKLQNEFRKKEEEFIKEKKKLLRDLETSELKLEKKDKEKENFKNKLADLSEDYKKKIETMHIKHKNKMKKFESLLKKSLDEINED